MATYSKGFKKRNGEQTLLFSIVAIIGFVLLIVGVAFIYDLATDTGEYTDFTHIEAYDLILTQKDESSVQLQDYVVYIYSDDCSNCLTVKKDVLKLSKELEEGGLNVFFVNSSTIKETTTGDKTDFLDDVNINSIKTPMIVTVANGSFDKTYIGTDSVVNLLQSVVDGEYAPFN